MRTVNCGLVVGLICVFVTSGRAQPDQEAVTKAAIVGHATTYASFSYYTVKYTDTVGEAASLEEALAGKWRPTVTTTVIHIVDGDKERYEQTGGSVDLPKTRTGPKGTSVSSATLPSYSYLAGPIGDVMYSPTLQSANLTRREEGELTSEATTPLGVQCVGQRNRKGPSWMESNPGLMKTEYLGRMTVDGINVIGARFTRINTRSSYEYWFDPARGYLPARCNITTDGELALRVYLQGARQCSQGRWFPEVSLAITPYPNQTRVQVREIKVLELNVDTPPKDEDFFIKIPAGTQVSFRYKDGFFKLKQDETIYAHTLDDLFTMSDRAVTTPLADTGLPVYRKWGWPVWVAIGVGVLLVVVGTILWYRRRGNRPTTLGGATCDAPPVTPG
ncbi:MAG: hypothetical protein L0241_04760 [Planctomycetia bacterium]|nr:hypothetical protein [Planctomycetia bacterium]